MNNLQIQYFLSISNNQSFSKAARKLYVSQPTLSKHIANLEEELGVTLFDRTIRSSTNLTPAGELFYNFFSKYVNEFNNTIKEARLIDDQSTGRLKICCLEGLDLSNFLEKVQAFNSRYPYIDISFECNNFKGLARGVESDYYDLGISLDTQFKDAKLFNTKVIADAPNIVLFSCKHHLANKENLDLTDFEDDILYVLSSEETPPAREINEAICNSKGLIPRIKLMPNIESILLALNMGKGYTILDYWCRAKDNRSYKYFKIHTSNTISMVWRKANANTSFSLFLDEFS